jgi:hypothetical protein
LCSATRQANPVLPKGRAAARFLALARRLK